MAHLLKHSVVQKYLKWLMFQFFLPKVDGHLLKMLTLDLLWIPNVAESTEVIIPDGESDLTSYISKS